MYREAQVRAGMALLDERAEPGWEDRLNLDTLNIDSSSRCVLGQLYGHYGVGLFKARVLGNPEEYGFSSGYIDVLPSRYGAELTQTWIELVTQRRQPVPERKLVPIPKRELVTA